MGYKNTPELHLRRREGFEFSAFYTNYLKVEHSMSEQIYQFEKDI